MRNKLLVVASLVIVASMVLGACATPPPQTVVRPSKSSRRSRSKDLRVRP